MSALQGIASIGHEGIQTKISNRESYAIDIGLLWMGFHLTESLGLALTGYLISFWGFGAPFMLAALAYLVFCIGAYRLFDK